MKTLLSLVALASLALVGCGSPKSPDGTPLDTKRPPSPPPPSANGMSAPPSTPSTTG